MSRKTNCWDNAVAESFLKTLKTELVYGNKFESIEDAKSKVFEQIEIWYNKKRLHSSLGYQTPHEVDRNLFKRNAKLIKTFTYYFQCQSYSIFSGTVNHYFPIRYFKPPFYHGNFSSHGNSRYKFPR